MSRPPKLILESCRRRATKVATIARLGSETTRPNEKRLMRSVYPNERSATVTQDQGGDQWCVVADAAFSDLSSLSFSWSRMACVQPVRLKLVWLRELPTTCRSCLHERAVLHVSETDTSRWWRGSCLHADALTGSQSTSRVRAEIASKHA